MGVSQGLTPIPLRPGSETAMMNSRDEQEAGRQRMRELFRKREEERGNLRHKQIFGNTQNVNKNATGITDNQQVRQERKPTAS